MAGSAFGRDFQIPRLHQQCLIAMSMNGATGA
jgi:hypothetical protein